MGEKKEVPKIPLNEMLFGKGGKVEQEIFSGIGKVARSVKNALDGK